MPAPISRLRPKAGAGRAERLADLAEHLRAADLAVVDAPFGVVAGGGAVVVAGVDVADLVGGRVWAEPASRVKGTLAFMNAAVLPPGPRVAARRPDAGVAGPPAVVRRSSAAPASATCSRCASRNGRGSCSADPAAVREVFTAPADLMHAGDANAILRPMLGPSSVLLLDGAEHLHQRRLMLPAFHGERLRRYREIMVEATGRVLDALARRGGGRAAPARAGDHARGHRPRGLRRRASGRRRTSACARCSRRARPPDARAADGARSPRSALISPRIRRSSRASSRRRRRAAAARSPSAARAPDLAERDDVLSMLLLARDEDGRGLSDARAARRAHDAARRRPRDDGELARVGVRAARPHRRARSRASPATRGTPRPRSARRCGCARSSRSSPAA